MKPKEVKKYFGSLYRFNKDTGMACNSLSNWLKWGFIPLKSQQFLEEKTQGKLVARFDKDEI